MLSRSRAVCMGYLNNKEKTLETIDEDGWLHSGDLIRMDEEGFYKVVGRIKEIIIPAGGENVAPTNIEEEIKRSLGDVISHVMVCGEGRPFLSALITFKARLTCPFLLYQIHLHPPPTIIDIFLHISVSPSHPTLIECK